MCVMIRSLLSALNLLSPSRPPGCLQLWGDACGAERKVRSTGDRLREGRGGGAAGVFAHGRQRGDRCGRDRRGRLKPINWFLFALW